MAFALAALFLLAGPAMAEMDPPILHGFMDRAEACGEAQVLDRACGGEAAFPDSVQETFLSRAREMGASDAQIGEIRARWDEIARLAREEGGEPRCGGRRQQGLSPMARQCSFQPPE